MRPIDFPVLFLGLVAVSFADVLAKKISHGQDSVWGAVQNPLFLAILAMYMIQILVFLYVFVRKAELGIVGIAQTVIYAIIVVGSGVLFFHEGLSFPKVIGTILAIGGVVLMNFSGK